MNKYNLFYCVLESSSILQKQLGILSSLRGLGFWYHRIFLVTYFPWKLWKLICAWDEIIQLCITV